MFKNAPRDHAAAGEELQQDETPSAREFGADDLLYLISKFLQIGGNVLLIQGPPGDGKTTLALELLERAQATRLGHAEIPPARLDVASEGSAYRLRKSFPLIQNIMDP